VENGPTTRQGQSLARAWSLANIKTAPPWLSRDSGAARCGTKIIEARIEQVK
jgi:hypothetical protein